MKPTEVKLTEIKHTEIKLTEMKPIEMKPTEMKPNLKNNCDQTYIAVQENDYTLQNNGVRPTIWSFSTYIYICTYNKYKIMYEEKEYMLLQKISLYIVGTFLDTSKVL